MPPERIALSLVIHNHQPVGNFGFVIADNHRLAYEPMLSALERHPGVRVGLHYTGPLLEWLRLERPATIERIRRLVERDQVELLGGGYYEPVLASLPQRDRIGQLERMAEEIRTLVGRRPRGAWLAERVWEPDLPVALAGAGYEYTILDDAHLRAAAIPDQDHWGIYSTDDRGRRLLLFGTEQGLRYHIPFRPVEEVIDYLRRHATEGGDRVGMMGDDGEKFGAWPSTWELCWGREAWVDRFFTALEENDGWLSTLRPADAIDTHRPLGRTYIPTGSYAEMGEWSLPLEARREFTRISHAARSEGRPEARWLRGGFWRNFGAIYREIGDLHKQMLRTSQKVASLPPDDPRIGLITDHLYRGQSNDSYWHGLFGGVYLSHLRLATAAHLIAAEDGAERVLSPAGDTRVTVEDIDLDGADEVLLVAPGQVLTLKPDAGGAIGEWDIRAARHALTSVMRRRPEAYHDALIAHEAGADGTAAELGLSVDDAVRTKEPGLAERLWFDAGERRSGLIRFLPVGTTLDELERGEATELGDFVSGGFSIASSGDGSVELEMEGSVASRDGSQQPVHVRRSYSIAGGRTDPLLQLAVEVVNRGSKPLEAQLAIESSLNMLGGGGNPRAWLRAGAERERFDGRGQVEDAHGLSVGNDDIGIELQQRPGRSATVQWYSIETISLSEGGFERNHQGSCSVWSWPLHLAPGESATFALETRVATSVDRAKEEGL